MKLQDYKSLGEMIRDPRIVWYGPHECAGCKRPIVKSSNESGGLCLDAPQDSQYPNHAWRLHQCRADGVEIEKVTVDLSVGKIIRIKSPSPHAHSIWRVVAHMDGANQQENLVAIRRLELNPGNNVDGKAQPDSIVPMALLGSHPLIENV